MTAPLNIAEDDALDCYFLERLREIWPGKLVLKGVLGPRDAQRSARCGADGIVVSNHGGIFLDCAVAPIEALADKVAASGDRLTILLDGGIRRGSDVVKAPALGADMVLVGRAVMYALAANGEEVVVDALGLLRSEIDQTLAQLGCRTVADLTSEHVVGASTAIAHTHRFPRGPIQ
jgi:(S)-mandelate dehydrogenase